MCKGNYDIGQIKVVCRQKKRAASEWMRRVGVGSRLLHVGAFLIRVGSDRLAGLQLAGSVSEFGESLHQTVD